MSENTIVIMLKRVSFYILVRTPDSPQTLSETWLTSLFSCLDIVRGKSVIMKVNNPHLDLGCQQRPSKWHHRE
jgi:hypothetical protein